MDKQGLNAVEKMYYSVRNLADVYPGEFSMINSGYKRKGEKTVHSDLMTGIDKKYRGILGRVDMWKKRILHTYYNLLLKEISEGEKKNLEVKVSDHFFRSRFLIRDKTNGMKFTVKSPWFSSLGSYLFGSFIKMRFSH